MFKLTLLTCMHGSFPYLQDTTVISEKFCQHILAGRHEALDNLLIQAARCPAITGNDSSFQNMKTTMQDGLGPVKIVWLTGSCPVARQGGHVKSFL